jgi:large subunit ribosomal protein L28
MIKKCVITGKTGLNGNKVSHSNIKTKHRKGINIHKKRIFDTKSNSWIKLKITCRGLKNFY